jgi:conjugal transfer/entry exclusion protein
MLRKQAVSDKLDQLQLAVERLKSSLVVPIDPGDVGTPIEIVVQQLQQIENQIDQIVNLVQLEYEE